MRLDQFYVKKNNEIILGTVYFRVLHRCHSAHQRDIHYFLGQCPYSVSIDTSLSLENKHLPELLGKLEKGKRRRSHFFLINCFWVASWIQEKRYNQDMLGLHAQGFFNPWDSFTLCMAWGEAQGDVLLPWGLYLSLTEMFVLTQTITLWGKVESY